MEKKITTSPSSLLTAMLPELAGRIIENEILAPHTTFKVGGPADFYFQPHTPGELVRVLNACRLLDLPVTVLGCGSNVVVSDEGIRDMVIQLGAAMTTIRLLTRDEVLEIIDGHPINPELRIRLLEDCCYIQAQSGALLADLSAFAADAELTGLEFACGIPGSVGGAVYMNAGAYGFAVEDVIIATEYIDENNRYALAVGREHDHSYRHSLFSEKGGLILSSIFQLKPGHDDQIRSMIADFTQRRESTQPLEYPSAGSVFKRPTGYFAGKLISDAGLRGYRIGGAEVSTKHAGFIINVGSATSSDIEALVRYIQKTVYDKFGVELETEVRILS